MANGHVIFVIDPETGEIEISVKGVKGKVCSDLTADVEKALGKVTETKKTREYREADPVKIGSKRKVGN